MEKQKGYELMLRKFGESVNDLADSGDDPNQQSSFHGPREPSSYYEFLTQNSPLLQQVPTHVFDSISASAPVSDPYFVQAMSEIIYNNNPGTTSASKQAVSSPDMDAWKSNPYPYIFNSDSHNALPHLRCSEQYDEMDSFKKINSLQNQTPTQSHSSLTQEPSGGTGISSRGSRRRREVSASVNVPRRLASSTDRKRRERIAERVKALQELLPKPVEGSQMAVMDEIIGYVKHLQQKMKELSKSKLGGDFRPCPSIFIEGNQHYEQTMKEPLEVTFAKLLKVDTSAAIKFLESKGLFVRELP